MLRWKDKPYVLHLHQERLVLSRQNKTCNEIVAECSLKDRNTILAVESCVTRLPQKSAEIEVVLDDSYARFWQVTPPLHVARLADLQAAASMRFESLFDLPGNDWTIEAAWSAKEDFWACALPSMLIHTIEQTLHANQKKIKISGCYPYFIQQWNQHAGLLGKKAESFAVAGDGALTVALISDGSIKSIRALALANLDQDSLQTADKAIHSLSLQLGIDPPGVVLLAGDLHGYRKEVITKNIRWHQISSVSPVPTRSLPALKEAA